MHRWIVALAVLWTSPVLAAPWAVDYEQSTVTFNVTQMGSPVEGSFSEFTAEIDFDPEAPEAATAKAEITLDSVDTGNSQRDGGIKGREILDTANHPLGTFESQAFSPTGDNTYDIDGSLTMRGISQPIVLPVTILVDGTTAIADGELSVNRRDFEIGVNNDDADKLIGETVTIKLHIVATAE